MNILIGTILIWGAALWCLQHVRASAPERLGEVAAKTRKMFLFMVPRILAGLIGAGFLAALLPQQMVARAFGAEAGLTGILLGTLFGALSPGGPFVALAIGAAALKAGSGTGALIAYITSWSLFALTRTLSYEVPIMGARFTRLRLLLALPAPILLGLLAHLIELLAG